MTMTTGLEEYLYAVADADTYCVGCAVQKYGAPPDGVLPDADSGYTYDVWAGKEDNEGNRVGWVHTLDHGVDGPDTCCVCHTVIVYGGCVVCGQRSDECLGHGPMADPWGYDVIVDHDHGHHALCYEYAECQKEGAE